jgi:hypothetical protein
MTTRLPTWTESFLAACSLTAAGLAQAASPPAWQPLAVVPAAARAWDAAEHTGNPMIVRSAFVSVNASALAAAPIAGAPPLATFSLDLLGRAEVFDVQRVEWTLGYRSLTGTARGGGEVHLSFAPDGTTSGHVQLRDALFALAPTDQAGVHVVQQLDPSRLPPGMAACGTDHTHVVVANAPAGLAAATNTDCDLTTVDVLVCYTPAARQGAGGTTAMETVIVNAIAQANTGHASSGVPVQFRLVHMHETTYVETDTGTDLNRFRGTTDGFMDEVHALRNTYGADLMHLLINQSSAFCGIANLMGSLSTGFASSAFAVTVRTCIPNHTLTHECGHNMGSHHDAANAGTAIYPYSYGYRTPDNAYRTIMAYAPGTRVNRWSSPNVVYQGYTMGIAGSADNTLSLTNTCTTVAAFRATTTLRWCDLDGGIAGAAGVPTLTGTGTINLVVPPELTIRDFAANAPGLLIVGASEINVPVFGGILVPSPDIPLAIVGSGTEIVHDASWLANLSPGTEIWFQAAFLDAVAVATIAASDAVKVTVP